jgi:hypothetical protein
MHFLPFLPSAKVESTFHLEKAFLQKLSGEGKQHFLLRRRFEL